MVAANSKRTPSSTAWARSLPRWRRLYLRSTNRSCDLGVLHAIDATRFHLTMKWVVSFSISRRWDRFDGNAPAQALQAPEEHVERTYIIRSAEEGQDEAQGPEAVGHLGVSIKYQSSRRWRRGRTRLDIPAVWTGSRPRRSLRLRRLASMLQAVATRLLYGSAASGFSGLDNLHSAFRAERGAGFSVRASP